MLPVGRILVFSRFFSRVAHFNFAQIMGYRNGIEIMKKVLVVLLIFACSGCVNIETPDHLVADTIQAGKDIYHSIKENTTEAPTEGNSSFAYRYPVQDGETFGDSSSNCINRVVEMARKSLNIYNLRIADTSVSSLLENGHAFIVCEILVLRENS